MQIVIKKGVGLTPIFSAMDKEIGKIKAAAALLVINSVNKSVMIKITASKIKGPNRSVSPMANCAMAPASPELSIALLMAKAPAMVMRISQEINFVYFLGG